jgi:hypothetical protein
MATHDPLREAREAMDSVHKGLLDAARADWESKRGPIAGPGQFLELLMNDPFFAWTRALSGLMAEIDEAIDAGEELGAERLASFRARAESILLDARYVQYLQNSADLVVEHAALRRALQRL